MRQIIIAGNWKMNLSLPEGLNYLQDFETLINGKTFENKSIYIFPPYTHLKSFMDSRIDERIKIGAQNCHQEVSGAFTGEISAPIINSLGCKSVIIGHSERRKYFNETSEVLLKKIEIALHYGLEVFFCCGELLEQRKSGSHFKIVEKQLSETIFKLSEEDLKNLIIAYEPVWAIGTGETASPQQAQEMHEHIRNLLKSKFNDQLASNIHILYGGSVKPSNSKELFDQKDIDGGLIGGASLNPNDFFQILSA